MAHIVCDLDHYVEHLRQALEHPVEMSRVRFRWGGRLETLDAQPIRRLVQNLHDVIPYLSQAAAATDNLPGDRMLAGVALDSITKLSHFVPKKRPGLQHHLDDAMHVALLVAQMVDPCKEIYHLNLISQCDIADLLAKMDESYVKATEKFVSGIRKTLYGVADLSSTPKGQRG